MLWIAIALALVALFLLLRRLDRLESTRLKVGDLAPDFELPSQTGELIRLTDLLQRGPVVLYFYVRDATPG